MKSKRFPYPLPTIDRIITAVNITTEAIRQYWNDHIHDLEIARSPVGSAAFFQELATYRYNKLRYLPQQVDFTEFHGKKLLEIGCGVGIDMMRFAQAGAICTGIDLADTSIALAQQYAAHAGVTADFLLMDGEAMLFEDETFDVVYAHGVLQYAADPDAIIRESYRVLKPGGRLIAMVYNRVSWLPLMSALTRTSLEHDDAPAFGTFSIGEFQAMLSPFPTVEIVPERFPVATELHTGLKATLYNDIFVKGFNAIPRPLVRRFGWHLMGYATK